MAHLLPFLLFSLVASITPGPTNILVLGHSARYGLRSALPLVAGGCVAASSMILLVGLGCGQLLLRYPHVRLAMAWVGVIWLSVMALKSAATVASPTLGLALLALLFLLISLPCMALWAGMGTAAQRLLPSARGMARFNRAMAILLLTAACVAAPL